MAHGFMAHVLCNSIYSPKKSTSLAAPIFTKLTEE